MFYCKNCKKVLSLRQQTSLSKEWRFDTIENFFKETQEVYPDPIRCSHCSEIFDKYALTEIGMYHHFPHRKQGTGTNFHSIYKKRANIYHQFSLAEDQEGLILQKIIDLSVGANTLLDIGCGTGKYVNQLSEVFKKIYALDNSSELLTFARKNNKKISNIEYLLADAAHIPLLDKSVDVIISTWGSFSPNETVHEMKRVLSDSGIIIRIGITALDDLTEFFGEFDKKYVSENNDYFALLGFATEYMKINVTFDTLAEAKHVIAAITGKPMNTITQKTLIHKVIVQTYKKPTN